MLSNFAKFAAHRSLKTICNKKSEVLFRRCATGTKTFYSTGVEAVAAATAPIVSEIDIPDPPAPALDVDMGIVSETGEVAFSALNLGGWSPIGIAQSALEFIHITGNVPWWATIVIGTAIVRAVTFPVLLTVQKQMTSMSEIMPEMQRLQSEINDCRKKGDYLEMTQLSSELMLLMKNNNIKPLKNLLVPAVQIPFFISFFFGLKQMTNLPVESMKTGGLYWFTDLTVPDCYLILPAITCLTVLTTIEFSMGAAMTVKQNSPLIKYGMRCMPIIMFPFIMKFPSGILCYWVSTNFISLLQSVALRQPRVRKLLNLGELVKHDSSELPLKSKGFIPEVKNAFNNFKLARKVSERANFDVSSFKSAGLGPIIKTYKNDPTKQSKAA